MTASLHPRGTLRARFEPVASDVFRRLGVGARSCDLGDEGLYLAEELVAADVGWLGSGEHPEALAILVLALMIAQRQGSTRLPLDPKGPLRTLIGDVARLAGVELDIPRVLRTITNLTKAPRFNSVIGMRGARLPLVVEADCLYTERARWLEDRVSARIAERIAAPRVHEANQIAAIAARVAAESTRPLSAEQCRAVEIALSGRLAVVTGGPGTGKTLVAAAIVRGFTAMGIEHVTLAAQTGKAANRLTEVIAEQRVIVEPAQTLHRLLGYRAGSRTFGHHAQSPLPVGAVIVDEASMIDLELVDALLDALPADAPLVLIGDAHQLPAIDAGQVLADLTGDKIAAPIVAVLEKSYRQDTSDPDGRAVYDAARAIHD
nr:AAA family ATPase [Deltaproteobacteria bacterium]